MTGTQQQANATATDKPAPSLCRYCWTELICPDCDAPPDDATTHRRVMIFGRWLSGNKLQLVDARTNTPPQGLAYLIEGLMIELEEGLP